MLLYFLLLLLLQIFVQIHTAADTKCDNSYCNREGECTMVNDVRTCKCLGTKYFKGTTCNEMVDNCAGNPCKNGATCTNAIGQYVCSTCAQGFSGQNCEVSGGDMFSRLYLLFNHYAHYDEEVNFMLTVESLGKSHFVFELFAPNYLIATFDTDPSKSKNVDRWEKSSNLAAVARRLGIRHSNNMPYQRGYYHVAAKRFWEVGEIELWFRAVNIKETAVHSHKFKLQIEKPDSVKCVPDIEFMHCAKPMEPLFLDIARYNMFEPIVRKRCGGTRSVMQYSWTIWNSIGTVQLHNFGRSETTLLKVPPYHLWYEYHGEVMQSYMIHLDIKESYGSIDIRKEARCYVFVMSKPVFAKIVGGDYREVGYYKQFLMDGSHSRDCALSPKVEQKMTFRWDCESADDPNNRYCKKKMSYANKLIIFPGQFQLHQTYTFTFYIRSIVNIYSTHKTQQVIKLVSWLPHYIAINCVRNCLDDKYIPGQVLHLQGECLSCTKFEWNTIVYTWSLNGATVGGNSQRLVYTPPDAETITIKLHCQVNHAFEGSGSVKLTKNKPPSGGSCTIEPAGGIEYETDFYIQCINFKDEDLPLWYQYIAETLTFDRTNDKEAHLRLPQLSSIKVIVCDFLFSCTENQVSVSVSAMQTPADAAALGAFLLKEEYNIKYILQNGDIQRAIVLVYALTKSVPSLEAAMLIYEQLRFFRLYTMLEVEQMTVVTLSLLKPLQPLDNEKVALFALLFNKIAAGFEAVIRDGEVNELLPEPYKTLTTVMMDMLAEFSVELETIPEVQSPKSAHANLNDPLAETYADFGNFDITVLTRVENWLSAIEASFKCMHYIGVAATNMHEPTEEPFIIEKGDLKMEVFSFEGTKTREVQTKDDAATITLNPGMLAELEKLLGSSHVLLQVISQKTNPFWWYPDDRSLNTGVFYLSTFSKTEISNFQLNLTKPFDLVMKLTTPPKEAAEAEHGYLQSRLDMPIYQMVMPQNTVLVVKFVLATERMRIILQLGVKPRGYQVKESKDIVEPGSTDTKFLILNDQPEKKMAYLAVLPANDISTRANFDFTPELRKCVSWNFHLPDPQWTTESCRPALEPNVTDSMHCKCYQTSIFAGKIFPINADEVYGERILLESVPVNWYMVLFYLLLFLLLLLILFCARKSARNNKEHLITEITDKDYNKDFDIMVYISTGGHWNAGTSANVSLTFVLTSGTREFIIYQNPEDPHLTQNSTCKLKLPLNGADIATPMKLIIAHDNAGRYPSWYCRSIRVEDVKSEQIHRFKVKKWITTQPVEFKAIEHDEAALPTKRTTFKHVLETWHIHWFQFQPLMGPWKYGDEPLNRLERTCIWISQVSVTICIVACYFGRTTIETYEEERERYSNISFNPWEILLLCLVCYFVGLLIELGFRFLL